MEFKKYFEEIKNCDNATLEKTVIDFINEWNKNPLVNEFEYKMTKEKFFDLVCDKIIESKNYPIDIHSYLVNELLGKQAKKIINNMRLPQKIVKDYETKFLETKNVYEKIDFIETNGIDFDLLEKSILSNANFKILKYYADNIENANIPLIINKLNVARVKYSTHNSKKTAENKNLCTYLESLKKKRELAKNREL